MLRNSGLSSAIRRLESQRGALSSKSLAFSRDVFVSLPRHHLLPRPWALREIVISIFGNSRTRRSFVDQPTHRSYYQMLLQYVPPRNLLKCHRARHSLLSSARKSVPVNLAIARLPFSEPSNLHRRGNVIDRGLLEGKIRRARLQLVKRGRLAGRFERGTEEVRNDYAARHGAQRGGVQCTLRAMCEASRGRQLRLIRAETDSGRSDGYLIL